MMFLVMKLHKRARRCLGMEAAWRMWGTGIALVKPRQLSVTRYSHAYVS
jgi:hypothetical protein